MRHVPGAPILRDTFLFLRTKFGIENANEALDALAANFPDIAPEAITNYAAPSAVPVLGFGDDESTWSDGLALRFRTCDHPKEVAAKLDDGLKKFESWLVHDAKGNFEEYPKGGPVSRFFEQLWDDEDRKYPQFLGPVSISQILVLGDPSSRRYQQAIEGIRSSMRDLVLPVFHFRDGQVMFLCSNEPAKITERRCSHHLKSMDGWVIVDNDGSSYTESGPDERVWIPTELHDLQYDGQPETE